MNLLLRRGAVVQPIAECERFHLFVHHNLGASVHTSAVGQPTHTALPVSLVDLSGPSWGSLDPDARESLAGAQTTIHLQADGELRRKVGEGGTLNLVGSERARAPLGGPGATWD
ncbi:MAG TPA: hypothetical protein VF167_06710 [Longimicrobiaceae bacterium]